MYHLMMHSTHFYLQLYGGHMVKDHSDRERKPATTWTIPSN